MPQSINLEKIEPTTVSVQRCLTIYSHDDYYCTIIACGAGNIGGFLVIYQDAQGDFSMNHHPDLEQIFKSERLTEEQINYVNEYFKEKDRNDK